MGMTMTVVVVSVLYSELGVNRQSLYIFFLQNGKDSRMPAAAPLSQSTTAIILIFLVTVKYIISDLPPNYIGIQQITEGVEKCIMHTWLYSYTAISLPFFSLKILSWDYCRHYAWNQWNQPKESTFPTKNDYIYYCRQHYFRCRILDCSVVCSWWYARFFKEHLCWLARAIYEI